MPPRERVFLTGNFLDHQPARKWIHLFTAMSPPTSKKRTYPERILKIVVAAGLTAFLAYLSVLHSSEIQRNVAERDSIAYWTAGRLLLHHQNPYDAETVLKLERRHGYSADKPFSFAYSALVLISCPAIGISVPFGAWMLWTAISLASLLFALQLCWKIYGAGAIPRNLFSLIGYTLCLAHG